MADVPVLPQPTTPYRLHRSCRGAWKTAVLFIPVAVALFLPGKFFESAGTVGSIVISEALVGRVGRSWVDLSPDGIATAREQYPWEELHRIEVLDGRFYRQVRIVHDGQRIRLVTPAAQRTVFASGSAEFDAGIAELRRRAEAYAPQAEIVYRRRGPAWQGDLLLFLLSCTMILLVELGHLVFDGR